MTDEAVLAEIRKYRKLGTSSYARDACFARKKAAELMREFGVDEEEVR